MRAITQPICFVDTETTGLDPDVHEIYEVGLITPDGEEHHWWLPVDLGKADPRALEIGNFYDRYPERGDPGLEISSIWTFAKEFEKLTRGMHLGGCVPSFDEERLRKLLRRKGAAPGWHYHIVDVEPLMIGFIAGCGAQSMPSLPWKSADLSRSIGVDPDLFEKHTALGDARWARECYLAVMGDMG